MEKDYLNNIKEIRKNRKLSQEYMAEKLGFAQSNYNKIEKGIVELSVNRLYEIAKILEVSIFQILIDKDIQILQEKIRGEIENKQNFEFQEQKLEEIKNKYKEEFQREIEEQVKVWFDDVNDKFSNLNPIPETPERIAEREKKNKEIRKDPKFWENMKE